MNIKLRGLVPSSSFWTWTAMSSTTCSSSAVAMEICPADFHCNDVQFIGGCNGNLQGISKLVKGMKYEDVKARLDGIRCGFKPTSCPDQLVRAMEAAMAAQGK